MNKKNKNPELRFKGFTEDWKKIKLGNIADIVGGGTPSTQIKEYWNGEIDWYSPTEIGKEIYANGSVKRITSLGFKNCSAQILPPNKTILFTSRAGIGDAAILCKAGTTNQGFQSLILKEGMNVYFIYSSIPLIKKFCLKNASGSTFLEISGKMLEKMVINLPSTTEQNLIGLFFQNLDNLITLHQKKYDKLIVLKKAMLVKMFPKDGAVVPEIRFKGFSGDWEEKELRELAVISTGYPFDSKTFSEKGEYLVITNGNIQNDSSTVDNSKGNRINIVDTISHYLLDINDILVTMDGTVGRTAKVINNKQVLAQRVGRLKAIFDSEFLYQFLNTGDFFTEMKIKSHGGTIKHISLTEIGEYKNIVPNSEIEQQKIGKYFQNLDTQINLHQTQLNKLKNIKKACFTKMFVSQD